MILGIDEVGRGPWAGPLVVGAVVLGGIEIEGLTDSKKLSKKRREALNLEIRKQADGYGIGWVEAGEIDKIGLSAALRIATKRAVEQINTTYHEIIIDGTVNFLSATNKGKYVTTMKKADLLIPSVSAASIIAKVARDNYMAEQDEIYPGYGFASHVGYGTAAHIAAIDKLGVTPLHRLSFSPLKKYSKKINGDVNCADLAGDARRGSIQNCFCCNQQKNFGDGPSGRTRERDVTTKQIGDFAENKACEYLKRLGHKIIDRNWKTKLCEIDIISKKGETIFFVEVKYRNNILQGGGLSVITTKKLRQMKFAAEHYVLSNKIAEVNLRLAAISLTGHPPVVEKFLEIF